MSVNTKTISGRRDLTFHSLNEILSDVERLVASPNTKTIGNWPLDQLISHLAMTFRGSIDGFDAKNPFLLRLIGPFLKKMIVSEKKMSPGIKLPKEAESGSYRSMGSAEAALDELRHQIGRTQSERMEANHPAFGKMSHEDWITLHKRHSELHLSFAIPQ